MNFDLTDEQQDLRERVRAWCDNHRERTEECDRISEFPRELYREGMERSFGTVIIPEKYGGGGGGAMEYALVAEETGIFQISFQIQRAIIETGTTDQKQRYLPRIASGDLVGAISISEPETGSSLKSMETTATKKGDKYIINGVKNHVNLAAEADLHKVYAMTEEGLTAFLIEDDQSGITVSNKQDPIGTRYLPLYNIEFDEVLVDEEQLLLGPGDGYEVFFRTFNFSRIGNASEMLGHGKRAIESAVDWAKDREVGDNVVTDFQGIRWKIAELATRLRAAEQLRNEAAWVLDCGGDGTLRTSMAKFACANAALPATTEAIQITGAHGLYRDQPYEEHFRNVKTLEVAGGSREIMKNVISDELLDGDFDLNH